MTKPYAEEDFGDTRYFVYVAMCQDGENLGYMKIGRTQCFKRRLDNIQSGCPIPIEYFAIIECQQYKTASMAIEAALHKALGSRRTSGEWFRFNFQDESDKKIFNDACRSVFAEFSDCLLDQWWQKMSVARLKKLIEADRENAKRKEEYAIAIHSINTSKFLHKNARVTARA